MNPALMCPVLKPEGQTGRYFRLKIPAALKANTASAGAKNRSATVQDRIDPTQVEPHQELVRKRKLVAATQGYGCAMMAVELAVLGFEPCHTGDAGDKGASRLAVGKVQPANLHLINHQIEGCGVAGKGNGGRGFGVLARDVELSLFSRLGQIKIDDQPETATLIQLQPALPFGCPVTQINVATQAKSGKWRDLYIGDRQGREAHR